MNKSDKNINERISRLAREKKLHPYIQSKLKKIISENFFNGMPLSELSKNSYNYDFYAVIGDVKVHIEIIYSLSVVDRDINMLKSSDADLKIALIRDESSDNGAVYKKYLREMESRDIPIEQFNIYPLSLMFSDIGTSKLLNNLTEKIDMKSNIKGTIKHYEEIKDVLTEIGKSEDIDAIFELINKNLLSDNVFGISGFAQNITKIEAEIQNILHNINNIGSEKLCNVNLIVRKYRVSKFNNKILNLNMDDSINVENLITFFRDKERKKEVLKGTDFKQLLDLKTILDITTTFSESDLNFLSKYKGFSSTIFNNYAQSIAKEPFDLIKEVGIVAFIEISQGDEYLYENILRVLHFYKVVLEYRDLLLTDSLPELTYPPSNFLRQNVHFVVSRNKYYDTKTRVFASSSINFKDYTNLRDNKVYMWNLTNPKIPESIFSGSELSLHKILVKNIRGTDYLIASGEDNCIYVWDLKFSDHPLKMFINKEEGYVKLIDVVDLNNKPTIIGKSGDVIFYWDFFGMAHPIKEQYLGEFSLVGYDFKITNNKLFYCSKINLNLNFGELFSGKNKECELSKITDNKALNWMGVNATKLANYNDKILILLGGHPRDVSIIDTDKMELMGKTFEQKDTRDIITNIQLKMLNGKYYLIASTLKHKILLWEFEKDKKYPSEIECGNEDLYEIASQKINGKDYIFVSGIEELVYMIDPSQKRVIEKFEGAKGKISSIAIKKINLL